MSLYTLSEMDNPPEDGVWRPHRIVVRQDGPPERTVVVVEEILGKVVIQVAPGCVIETIEEVTS